MRSFISLALLAAASAPSGAAAQDEYELANALAERGWFDLSEELFGKMARVSEDALRAEGKYGLARIKILKAEKAETTEEKEKLYDDAIGEVRAFLKEFPNHKRRGEALSDVGSLYQSKGKLLMTIAKADPTKLEAAEKAFGEAEKLFTDLIERLKKEEKKRPDPDEKNPAKAKAEKQAYEEWEEKMMYAKYNYAVALFAHAETYKDNPAKHGDMRRLLEKMIAFLNNDFMWLYEWYLLAYDAFIYMGRAYQIMAETSERERAEDYWKQCFTYINKARGLLSDPENRKNEAVREICSRAQLYEIKARTAYGDTKRGPAAIKQYNDAAKLAEDFLRTFPNLRFEEIKAIRLEQARAYCKAGQLDKGLKLLRNLTKEYKNTWVENVAIDIIGEYAADQSVALAIEAADNYAERGGVYLYKAIQKYRKAYLAAKKPEDEKYKPYCWNQIGRCYYSLDRFYEAAAAFTELEKPPFNRSPEAPQAAFMKRNALARIARITKDKADEEALEKFRAWYVRTFPKEAGDDEIRRLAIDAELKQNYMEAVKQWEKLALPDKETYEEAVFSMGLDLYREGERLIDAALKEKGAEREKGMNQAMDIWKRALDCFQKHLQKVEKMSAKEPSTVKNALGSILFSAKIMAHPRISRAAEALKISEDVDKRFPSADPKLVIAIMWNRINAKVKLGQIQEAEDDFRVLKKRYEEEKIGLDYYLNAMAVLANAFQEAAEKEKGRDPEKYEIFSEKAGEYYYEYYTLNVGAVRKPEQMEGMADMLLFVAEQRMKKGQAAGNKEEIERARRIYDQARELFKAFKIERERDLRPDQIRTLDRKITRCYLMSGQTDEAIKIYEEITRNDPDKKDGSAWEDLADCYAEKARGLPEGGSERANLLNQADSIYAELASRLISRSLFNEHTWRLLLKHAQCLYEINIDRARFFFEQFETKGYLPKCDENEKGVSQWGFKPKFDELRRKIHDSVPPRKSGNP